MKKEILSVRSACDGLPLSIGIFSPETANGEIKGIFQISHGMAEHKERYFPFMEFMADNGYAAVINDHRGHGGSIKSPDDYGYFYDDTAGFIVEDLHQVTLLAKERFPGKPVTLFGHSMGSLVVRKYIKKYDDEIDKLIVCGSPSANPLVGAAIALVRAEKAVKGDRHRSMAIQKLAFGSYTKNLSGSLSDNAWLSVNTDNVKDYDKDRMCGFVFTLNGFRNLFLLMKQVYDPKGWNVKNPDLPILFLAGAEDPVIAGEKNWHKSQDFLRQVGYRNISGILYPGLRHEILNEASRQDIYENILEFAES